LPGEGAARAGRLVAAAELGQRGSSPDPRAAIRTSRDVATVVGPMLTGRTRERLVVVVCDRRACVVIGDGRWCSALADAQPA
jgi:DNA repair protein RadC